MPVEVADFACNREEKMYPLNMLKTERVDGAGIVSRATRFVSIRFSCGSRPHGSLI
jgi:hypothetical protein